MISLLSRNNTLITRDTRMMRLSDDELYLHFTERKWNELSVRDKQLVLQEVECRMAAQQKRPACPVAFKRLPVSLQGQYANGTITLNERMLRRPRSLFGYGVIGGVNALETLIHEGRHATQHAIVEGRCDAGDVPMRTRRAWVYNILSYVNLSTLDDTKAAFAAYAFQPIERDARAFAGHELAAIYRRIKRLTGARDRSFETALQIMQKQKVYEFEIARVMLSDERIAAVQAYQKTRFLGLYAMSDSIRYSEDLTLAQLLENCGVTSEHFDEMQSDQLADYIGIKDGTTQLSNYMDDLDTALIDVMPEMDVRPTLAELSRQVLRPRIDQAGISFDQKEIGRIGLK